MSSADSRFPATPAEDKLTIVVADDDPINRKYLRALLTQRGHTVIECADGLATLAQLERQPCDAVISDVLMPQMDGYRMCYEIRRNKRLKQIPVILYTAAYLSAEDEKAAMLMGADSFLRKPAEPDKILNALYEALEHARAGRVGRMRNPGDFAALREYSEVLVRKLEETNIGLSVANAALSEQEQRLRTIIESEPECVKVLAADGTLLEINPAGMRMIEAASAADLVGSKVDCIIAPEHRRAFQDLTEASFHGRGGSLVFEIIGIKGTRRWLESHAVPLRNSAGAIVACLAISRDITEQRKSAALVKDQVRVLEMIARGAPLQATLGVLLQAIEAQQSGLHCSILLVEKDGSGRLRPGAAPTLSQRALEATVGRPFEEAGPCGAAVRRREPVIVEDIAAEPSWGHWRTIALEDGLRAGWSTPILDAHEQIIGTFAMYFLFPLSRTDEHRRLIDVATHIAAIAITKKAEEDALRESEARFREMADGAPVMIWITRADGFCTYLNRQWQEFTGQSPETGRGSGWLDAVHPEDRARVQEEFQRANERCDAVRMEYRVRRRDDAYRWVIDSAQPRRSESGEFLGYIGSLFDITERREVEDERQRNLERARALQEINIAITSEMDLQARLNVLLEQLQRFFPDPIVSSVRLLRPETGHLEHLAFRGIDADQWLGREPGRRLHRARQVVATKIPVIVTDLDGETPGGGPGLPQLGLVSYAGLPLIAREQVLGVLAVYTKNRHIFAADEIDFLTALAGQAAIAIHNAQLYESAERRRREAEELARIARSLTETLDMKAIGDRVVASVIELFGVRGASLRLSQPDGSMARFVSAGEVFSRTEAGRLIPAGAGVAGRACTEGRAVWSANTLSDPTIEFHEAMRDYVERSGNGSMMAVPLRVRDDTIGVLALTDRTGRRYSANDLDLVQAFVDQVALALQNARLFERSERHLRRIEALREIEKAITSTLELSSVLQLLLDRIDVFLPFSAATTIRLYDRSTGTFENAACRNINEPEWKNRIGQGTRNLSGRLLRTKRPVVVRNIQEEPGISASHFYREYGFVSYLAVPLIAKDEVVGILGFYTWEIHDFTDEEVDLLLTLAGQAAIAISNARLYKEIDRSKQELETTNRSLEASLRQLDSLYTALAPIATDVTEQDLMNGIIDRVIEATSADAALIRLVDRTSRQLPIVAHRGFAPDYLRRITDNPLRGAGAWVVEHGKPIIAPDIAAEPRLRGKLQLELGLRSCALLPLEVHGNIQGILHVASRASDHYDHAQTSHLLAIARQMSIAVENRRLFEDVTASRDELKRANFKLSESNRMLSALHAVAESASQSLNLSRVLDRAIEKINEIFTFEAIRIHLYDESCGQVVLRASLERNPEQFAAVHMVSRGSGIIGGVVESGVPMVFEDVASDPRYLQLSRTRLANRFDDRFFAVFPIRSKLQVLGAMSCFGTLPRKLSEGEIQLLEALTDQLAVAIENTGLYEAVSLKVDELQRKTTELEVANRVKDEFLSVVSHELRTPINVIMGYTSLLKEGVLGTVKAAQEEAMAKIAREAKDLLAMINTLLYASSIDTEPGTLECQVFQPEQLLAELRANYAVTVAPQLTMLWRYPAALPALRTDRRKLRQILDNLIGNAIKFTERGSVTVSAGVCVAGEAAPPPGSATEPVGRPSWIEFAVADTGVGMPADKLAKIFEKFYQVDSSESRNYGGVGMGLYIAKRFADLLKGNIRVESAPGKGSTFYLRIPLNAESDADGPAADS